MRIPDKQFLQMLHYIFELEDNLYGPYIPDRANVNHYRYIYNKEYLKYEEI